MELFDRLKVVAELATRSWRNKQWTTRKSTCRGGKEFSKTSLHKLLTNPTYLGKVKYKQELHEGQHDGIVCPEVLTDIRVRAAEANVGPVNTTAVEEALRDFNPVWEALSPREQEQVLKLLVQRVDYDGRAGQGRSRSPFSPMDSIHF